MLTATTAENGDALKRYLVQDGTPFGVVYQLADDLDGSQAEAGAATVAHRLNTWEGMRAALVAAHTALYDAAQAAGDVAYWNKGGEGYATLAEVICALEAADTED